MVAANNATVLPGPVFVSLPFVGLVPLGELLCVEVLGLVLGLELVLDGGVVAGVEDVLGAGVVLLF